MRAPQNLFMNLFENGKRLGIICLSAEQIRILTVLQSQVIDSVRNVVQVFPKTKTNSNRIWIWIWKTIRSTNEIRIRGSGTLLIGESLVVRELGRISYFEYKMRPLPSNRIPGPPSYNSNVLSIKQLLIHLPTCSISSLWPSSLASLALTSLLLDRLLPVIPAHPAEPSTAVRWRTICHQRIHELIDN